jgi:hypothetical protein
MGRICMYGFGEGFGDAFFQTFQPTQNNRLFSALAVGVGGRSRARLGRRLLWEPHILVVSNRFILVIVFSVGYG